jgi:hypothetical protein
VKGIGGTLQELRDEMGWNGTIEILATGATERDFCTHFIRDLTKRGVQLQFRPAHADTLQFPS